MTTVYQRFDSESTETRAQIIERYRSLEKAAMSARSRTLAEQFARGAAQLKSRQNITDDELAVCDHGHPACNLCGNGKCSYECD